MNARYSHGIPNMNESRQWASETIGSISARLIMPCDGGFFPTLVQGLATELRVHYAFVSEFSSIFPWRARTISRWIGDSFGENYEYFLKDTPCFEVANGSTCFYPLAVQRLFPRDQDILQLGGESYLGVPIKNPSGKAIGHLAIMDTMPMKHEMYLRLVMKYFAQRAAEELECLKRIGETV